MRVTLLIVLAVLTGALAFVLLQGDEPQAAGPPGGAAAQSARSAAAPPAGQPVFPGEPRPAGRVESAGAIVREARPPAGAAEGAEPRLGVSARLLDEAGVPIADAVLGVLVLRGAEDYEQGYVKFLQAVEGVPLEDLPAAEARTAPDGRARVEVETPGDTLVVYARAANRELAVSWERRADLEDSRWDLGDIVLRWGGAVAVEVVDGQGQPVADAWVHLQPDFEEFDGSMPFHMLPTGADGRCRFGHLRVGVYKLTVSCNGFVIHSEEDVETTVAGTTERQVALQPGGVLSGQVLEADGSPAADVPVTLEQEDLRITLFLPNPLLRGRPWAVTQEDGRFSGSGLEPGRTYLVRAERDESSYREAFGLRAGDTVTLRLPARAGVRGRLLTADGRPAAGARVRFAPFSRLQWGFRNEGIEVDGEGRFATDLKNGRYRMAVWHEAGERLWPEPIEVDGALDLGELRLPDGGDLVLTAVAADTGAPVAGVVVRQQIDPPRPGARPEGSVQPEFASAGRAEQEAFERALLLQRGRPEPQRGPEPGVLRWRGLAPGEYTFSVEAEGHAGQDFTARIREGRTTEATVELEPGALLFVTVSAPEGDPPDEVILSLRRPGKAFEPDPQFFAVTEDDHTAAFSGLRPGLYHLFEGFPSPDRENEEPLEAVRVEAGENRVEVMLAARFDLTVRVQDADGPVAGAEVHSVSNSAFGFASGRNRGADPPTDDSGTTVLGGLKLGRHTIEAARPNGYPVRGETELTGPGQTLEIRLEGHSVSGAVAGAGAEAWVRLGSADPGRSSSHALGLDGLGGGPDAPWLPGGSRAPVGPAGGFVFRDVPNGTYFLSASAPGRFQQGPVRLEVADGDVEGLKLQLVPEAQLTLNVQGLANDYLRTYWAEVTEGGLPVGASLRVRHSGRYAFRGIAPGSYVLRIRRADVDEPEVVAELPVRAAAERETVVDWDASTDE